MTLEYNPYESPAQLSEITRNQSVKKVPLIKFLLRGFAVGLCCGIASTVLAKAHELGVCSMSTLLNIGYLINCMGAGLALWLCSTLVTPRFRRWSYFVLGLAASAFKLGLGFMSNHLIAAWISPLVQTKILLFTGSGIIAIEYAMLGGVFAYMSNHRLTPRRLLMTGLFGLVASIVCRELLFPLVASILLADRLWLILVFGSFHHFPILSAALWICLPRDAESPNTESIAV